VSRVGKRMDYDTMSVVYDQGRAGPPEAVEDWRPALLETTSPSSGLLLDLGSRTGFWSVFLADWFDSDVVAIEPFEGMRRQAADKRSETPTAWRVYLDCQAVSLDARAMARSIMSVRISNLAVRRVRSVAARVTASAYSCTFLLNCF
jgi:hypothetical protein